MWQYQNLTRKNSKDCTLIFFSLINQSVFVHVQLHPIYNSNTYTNRQYFIFYSFCLHLSPIVLHYDWLVFLFAASIIDTSLILLFCTILWQIHWPMNKNTNTRIIIIGVLPMYHTVYHLLVFTVQEILWVFSGHIEHEMHYASQFDTILQLIWFWHMYN